MKKGILEFLGMGSFLIFLMFIVWNLVLQSEEISFLDWILLIIHFISGLTYICLDAYTVWNEKS